MPRVSFRRNLYGLPCLFLAVCLGCRYEHAVRVVHNIGRVLFVDDHDAVAILLIAIPFQRKVEAAGDAELGRIPGAYGKLAGLAVCSLVIFKILDYLGRNSYGTAAHAAKGSKGADSMLMILRDSI